MSDESSQQGSGDKGAAETVCAVCGRAIADGDAQTFAAIRPQIAETAARMARRAIEEDELVCRACRGRARSDYLVGRLSQERGELSALEVEIARKSAAGELVAAHLDQSFERTKTRGQRLADSVARVGGSWPFVIGFGVVLVAWLVVNVAVLGHRAFDPYPFILLNLVLSCLAAVQAPIIMMSQNRTSARDRMQADHDFRVNLKAELEVAALHEKLDHLLHSRWADLLELQEAQIDLLTDLTEQRRREREKAP